MTRPGIRDVATAAGVSATTVSSFLNRPETVSAATRQRVEAAIAQLGYVRNESARQLRSGRSRSLVYIVHNAANPFFAAVSRGMEELLLAAGLSVFVCSSGDDPLREQEYLDVARQTRVRGVLITPVDVGNPLIRALPEVGIPVVLVANDSLSPERACSVSVDDVHGADLAVTHLLELGHREIAFIGGPTHRVTARYEGARRAVTRAGLPASALTVLDTAGLTVDEGRNAGQRLAGLPRAHRPTAAFCCNDVVALGLLQETTRRGVVVPGELSIVGYDDIRFAAAATVPLTSVRQPGTQLGRKAAELFMAEDATVASTDSHLHRHVGFRPELVVRSSSGPAPRDRA